MLKKMKARELDIPDYLALSPGCVALLHRLLEPEPERRATVAEIMQVRSPYRSEGDVAFCACACMHANACLSHGSTRCCMCRCMLAAARSSTQRGMY